MIRSQRTPCPEILSALAGLAVLSFVAGPAATPLSGQAPSRVGSGSLRVTHDPRVRLPETERGPVVRPGDLPLDPSRLPSHRLTLDETVYDPRTDSILGDFRLQIGFERLGLRGENVVRTQWFLQNHGLVNETWSDRTTFATLRKRLFRADGGYEIAFYDADSIRSHTVPVPGEARSWVTPVSGGHFDLLVIPYLLAAMDLERGDVFELPVFSVGSRTVGALDLEVLGRTTVDDARSEPVEVWAVDTRSSRIHVTWYVEDEQPYFVGQTWRTYDGEGQLIRVTHARRSGYTILDTEGPPYPIPDLIPPIRR